MILGSRVSADPTSDPGPFSTGATTSRRLLTRRRLPNPPPPAQLLGCRASQPRARHGVAPQGGPRRRPGLLARSGVPPLALASLPTAFGPGMPARHSHARPTPARTARAHLARRAPRLTERLPLGLGAQATAHVQCRVCACALRSCWSPRVEIRAAPRWFHWGRSRPRLDGEGGQRGKKGLVPGWPSSLKCSRSV